MAKLPYWSTFIACLMFWQLAAQAIDNIDIQIGKWSTEDLLAQGFDLELGLSNTGLKLTAKAEQLVLPEPFNTLHQVKIRCDKTQWFSGQLSCEKGELAFKHDELGQQKLNFSLSAKSDSEIFEIDISGLKLFDSNITVASIYAKADWQLAVNADSINLQKLKPWLAKWLNKEQLVRLEGWDNDAQLMINADVAGSADKLKNIDVGWRLSELNFSNASGSQIAESLTTSGQFTAEKQNNSWQLQADIDIKSGQAYFDPVFMDFEAYPTTISFKSAASEDFSTIDIPSMQLQQASLLSADIELQLHDNELVKLKVMTEPAQLEKLYPIWLQPFAFGTAASKLESSGEIAAQLDWQQDSYQLEIAMQNVSIEDLEQRFKVHQLNGTLGWSNNQKPLETKLQWQDAQVYAISLGEAEIGAQSQENGFKLTEALELPVLDGELLVNDFSLQQATDKSIAWTFDGLLTPISMKALSQALQWPELHGKLSGVIPKVQYSQQQLKIDGALQLKVFDGTTVIKDLSMTSPLGSIPQLYANIDISDIDLELLTRTFDFGRITGKLEGHVHHLRLSDWEPVEFDARLVTPQQNPGKRRISQRAVDNLTQIGGGAGMLSRSFLRFFDDFSYQKLGLACKLSNEVCEMSGIEEADQGYYIVKGGGGLPPWINVVGYTRQVDWSELIERLKSVQDSSGPVIQ
jgi:hypothetical protein